MGAMRNVLCSLIIIIPVLLGVWLSVSKQRKINPTISYKLEDKIYKLRTAKTPGEWEQGLMYVTKPAGYDGMIFMFPDKDYRTFWNKNTLVDLTIYWMDNDRIVQKDALPSITKSEKIVTVGSPEKVNTIIEIIK